MDESLMTSASQIGFENECQRLRYAQEELRRRYHEMGYYDASPIKAYALPAFLISERAMTALLNTAQIIPGVQGYNLDEKLLLTDQLV